jgi:hypothetical protein
MGKSNLFGESVDLGLLSRIPKGLQVRVARMGGLVNLSLTTMKDREWKSQPSLGEEQGYL